VAAAAVMRASHRATRVAAAPAAALTSRLHEIGDTSSSNAFANPHRCQVLPPPAPNLTRRLSTH